MRFFTSGVLLNISSALLKQILIQKDFDTWSSLRKHYLATEYHSVYNCINKHYETHHDLPSFEDLKYSVRDSSTREKLVAIERVEVEIEAVMLLTYLKNEYTQREILDSLDTYVDRCVTFEDAQESLEHLYQIAVDIESKVELESPSDNLQKMNLFFEDEELNRFIPLGLNADFDTRYKFAPDDFILLGGRRGAGKSITCANITNKTYSEGKSALYFTIEMNTKQIMQRCAAIGAGVPNNKLRSKNLSMEEWERISKWWSDRYDNGDQFYEEYLSHRSFDTLHKNLSTKSKLRDDKQIVIIYEPRLTLAKIEATINKYKSQLDIGVIVIDYINQIVKPGNSDFSGQYDWDEQIIISKRLKDIAATYNIPVVSPYQIDASGEARFSKGILDSADAAFILDAHTKDDNCMTFTCVKMRSDSDNIKFTSAVDWDCLTIGPESAELDTGSEESTGEDATDVI